MERITRNLERQFEDRELGSMFFEELHQAAQASDTQRFFSGVSYFLAALRELSTPQRRL